MLAKVYILVELIRAATYCPSPNQFCISGAPSNTTGQTCFTIHSAELGWAAIGVGSSVMSGADIYLGWMYQGQKYVGNFKGTGNVQPSPNSVQNAIEVSLLETPPTWAQLSFSFCRPTSLSSNGNSITASQSYIYASCPYSATGTTPASLSFDQHSLIYGSFAFDFTTTANTTTSGSGNRPILTPSGGYTYQQIVAIHGILMFIAWAVSPFLGIFCARYLKQVLDHNWYRLHVLFMAGTCGLVTVVSFIVIVLYLETPHFNDKHKIIGLIVFLSLFVQGVLGYISNALWEATRTDIPWWDKLHWWVGRALALLGVINVFLGIDLYEDLFGEAAAFTALFWTCVIAGCSLLIFGQWKYGQVHHQYSTV